MFGISARPNRIPFLHSTVSTATDAPAYKIGQRRISVFGRKTRSKRAATIQRAHYWARGRKAGLGGGRIFGVNCMTTQQAASRTEQEQIPLPEKAFQHKVARTRVCVGLRNYFIVVGIKFIYPRRSVCANYVKHTLTRESI